MRPAVVLVTFYSASGGTEKLATAVAVGAVQKGAAIRMRRVPDPDPSRTIQQIPEHQTELERMHRHYVEPKEADVLEADALVFGVPSSFSESSAEWTDYLDLLARLGAQGKLRGKVGVAVGGRPGLAVFSGRLVPLNLTPGTEGGSLAEEVATDAIERAIELGHGVVKVADSWIG